MYKQKGGAFDMMNFSSGSSPNSFYNNSGSVVPQNYNNSASRAGNRNFLDNMFSRKNNQLNQPMPPQQMNQPMPPQQMNQPGPQMFMNQMFNKGAQQAEGTGNAPAPKKKSMFSSMFSKKNKVAPAGKAAPAGKPTADNGKKESKFAGKNMMFMLLMLVVIATVCYSAFIGISAIESCKKEKNETLERNRKISTFSAGVAIGMGVYAFIPTNLVSIPMNFFIAILVATISGLNVNAYQSLEDCKDKDKIQTIYAIMYGFLGFGVGVIFYALLSVATKNMKQVTLVRAVLALSAIFCIILSSFNLTTASECSETSPNLKLQSIIAIVVSGLIFLGILASFKIIKP